MAIKNHTDEQAIMILKKIDVMISSGAKVDESCKKAGISDHTYYKWRKRYNGVDINSIRKIKQLEQENARLKRAVANLTLDNLVLKEATMGK